MWTIFDSIGSSMIGAAIMFMVFALLLQMNNISRQIEENNLIQSHYTSTMEILNYDLHKIGFKAPGDKILFADSDSIRYCTDLKDDGFVDTLIYKASSNDDDSDNSSIFIYRQVNSEKVENIGIVSDFNFSYYDSLGNTINYSGLVSSSVRAKIRSIEIRLEMAADPNDISGYNDINWRVRIKPRNLLVRN